MPQGTEDREARFWDSAARRAANDDLVVSVDLDEPETRRQIDLMGDVRHRRLLEVGCGTGEWAVILARQGAEVWAVDISPESVALTERRAKANGVAAHVHAQVMSGTEMEFDDGFFDGVHGVNIIHHLKPAAFGREIARVLVPEGFAVFSENSANNPVLMLARNVLCGRFGVPKWSSQDEYPLTRRDIQLFSRAFLQCEATYPRFLFFHYFDAKFFHYRHGAINRLCRSLDTFIYNCVPLLRRYSYRQVISCRHPARTIDD